MKSILMSIQPKWTAKILNGEKTIEIRKRFPKDYRGWVYIYCTKLPVNKQLWLINKDNKGVFQSPYGKVVARFYCDNVEEISYNYRSDFTSVYTDTLDTEDLEKLACLTKYEFAKYLQGNYGYAIHISQLEIFDKPKELSEFYSSFKCKRHNRMFANNNIEYDEKMYGLRQPTRNGYEWAYPLTKAPQSWCYVEDNI